MKANHIIFVPGLFGWGPGELGGFPYWGDALKQSTKSDFEHSTAEGHAQFSRFNAAAGRR